MKQWNKSFQTSLRLGKYKKLLCKVTWKNHAVMVKTSLSGAKINWKIHCQWYWLLGIFIFPVNPSLLNVVSNDACIVISLSSVLFVILRERPILLILFPRKPLNFDIVNVAVIHKGQIKKSCNSKVKPKLLYYKICRKIISSILYSVAHICRNNT